MKIRSEKNQVSMPFIQFWYCPDFPKLADKMSDIWTDRPARFVSPKDNLSVPKNSTNFFKFIKLSL